MTNVGFSQSGQSDLLNKYLEASKKDSYLPTSFNLNSNFKPPLLQGSTQKPKNALDKTRQDDYTKKNQTAIETTPKQSKKKKIAAISLGIATALTAMIALIKTKGFKNIFTKAGKTISTTLGSIARKRVENIKNPKTKEAILNFQKNLADTAQKAANIPLNANNGKDILYRKVFYSKKAQSGVLKYLTAPFRALDRVTTKIYKNAMIKGVNKRYNKSTTFCNALKDETEKFISFDSLQQTAKGSQKHRSLLQEAKEILSDLGTIHDTHFADSAIDKRFAALDSTMSRLKPDNTYDEILTRQTQTSFFSRLKELKGFKKIKVLTEKHIADDLISKQKTQLADEVNSYVGEVTNGTDGKLERLIDILGELAGDDPNLVQQLEKNIKPNARIYKKTLLKASKTEMADLVEKLRDVNCGGAPTDIMTIIMSTLALGVYTAQADSKDERRSVILKTGIPVLTAAITCLAGTINMVAGIKSMLLGLATGQVAKILGTKIDKAYRDNYGIEEQPSTIVTLDDYIDKAKDITGTLIAAK